MGFDLPLPLEKQHLYQDTALASLASPTSRASLSMSRFRCGLGRRLQAPFYHESRFSHNETENLSF